MVTDEVVYMTADVEDEYVVAQANELWTRKATSPRPASMPAAVTRFWKSSASAWTHMDVTPEIVSVATAMTLSWKTTTPTVL